MNMITDAAHIAAHESARSAQRIAAGVQQMLAFRLGGEEYAIDILRVKEIRSYQEPTHIAQAPSHVLGVIDLRGVIVPIIDLRKMLSVEPVEYTSVTAVIVVNIRGKEVGIVVDAVSDVVDAAGDQILPAPQLGGVGTLSTHVLGLIPLRSGDVERMLIQVDIQGLLADSVTSY